MTDASAGNHPPSVTAPPRSTADLQVSIELDEPSGPAIASWRDQYVERGDAWLPLVELCVDELHRRKLCYSCGLEADRLVNENFRGCVSRVSRPPEAVDSTGRVQLRSLSRAACRFDDSSMDG